MKKFIINNLIGFTVGAIIFSGITYAATLNFASGDVEHTKADGTITTVSAAIDELYGKSMVPQNVTGNSYTGNSGYLYGSSALTKSTQLALANYKKNNNYSFNLGSKEQLTLPAGYYDLPINITNGGGSTDIITRTKSVSFSMGQTLYPSGSGRVTADSISGYRVYAAYLASTTMSMDGNLQTSQHYSVSLSGNTATVSFSASYSEYAGGTVSASVVFIYIKN